MRAGGGIGHQKLLGLQPGWCGQAVDQGRHAQAQQLSEGMSKAVGADGLALPMAIVWQACQISAGGITVGQRLREPDRARLRAFLALSVQPPPEEGGDGSSP